MDQKQPKYIFNFVQLYSFIHFRKDLKHSHFLLSFYYLPINII